MHGKIYIKKCEEAGVQPHESVLDIAKARSNDVPAKGDQGKIDGFIKAVPKWSKEGLTAHLVELVSTSDLVRLLLLMLSSKPASMSITFY